MDEVELRATLAAYCVVQKACFPLLHKDMEKRVSRHRGMSANAIEAELASLVAESNAPPSSVRVFWKTGPDLTFAGFNKHLFADSGLKHERELLGATDFDERLPWSRQAAKYRRDDLDVVASAKPKLDILERQDSADGTQWLRTGKAPILVAPDKAIGLLGMYGPIDGATASRLAKERGL